MKQKLGLLKLFLLISIVVSYGNSYALSLKCPSMNDVQSQMTMNNMGKSNYREDSLKEMLKNLTHFGITINDGVWDFGTGYGGGVYEMLKIGFKNIIASDLSPENIKCAKKFILTHGGKNKNLVFLSGDILNNGKTNEFRNHSLGLVYSKNVIHLMSANDIGNFFVTAHDKLKKNGLLFLIYENNLRAELKEMIRKIDLAIMDKNLSEESKNYFIKQVYQESSCSFEEYERTNSLYKHPGFPCRVFGIDKNKEISYQYIDLDILKNLLEKLHYNVLFVSSIKGKNGTAFILAQAT